jgi:hypothetical protein
MRQLYLDISFGRYYCGADRSAIKRYLQTYRPKVVKRYKKYIENSVFHDLSPFPKTRKCVMERICNTTYFIICGMEAFMRKTVIFTAVVNIIRADFVAHTWLKKALNMPSAMSISPAI